MSHPNIDAVLQVQDPDPTHVGRNIVTLDKETKGLLNITSGDIVEIEGVKKTAAIVWPARTEDEGKKIIRMDSFIRHNAGVGLNDKVKVRRVTPQEAKRVILAPIEEVRIIASGYERILKKSFLGRPLTIGDNVWVSVFGSGFIYRVVETQPRGIVKVTDATLFSLKEKPIKDALESVPKVAYEDIGGLDEQVKKVREMVELPMKHPELFQKLGIVPPKGILLYGPPGTGKTLLAKAVANEAQVHFISISAPEVMGKFVGEAEERVRNIFKEAQENAPSIIFIDEIDAIAPKRDEVVGEVERRVVAQLLSLMDGLEGRGEVIVMAATNRVHSMDEALRRPGRFDREIEFGIPDKKSRENILIIHTRGMPIKGTLYPDLVSKGFSKYIDKYLDENGIEKDKILHEIENLKSSKDSQKKTLLEKLTSNLYLHEHRLKKLEIIKRLISAKETLAELSDALTIIYHDIELRSSDDPRQKFFEKIKSKYSADVVSILEEIRSLDILDKDIWNKNSRLWVSVEGYGKARDIEKIANMTHGFVGADLQALAKEAAMKALRRYLPEIDLEEEAIPADVLEDLCITYDDFMEGLKDVQPSALREVAIEIPNVKWDDIGALEDVKQELKQAIEWPLKHPKSFKDMGITPPKGILLYGPPGTGKTLLAKAIATETEANFISIKGPELLSMWVGESEKGVRKIFKKARQVAPCIVFFDEMDSMASKRGANVGSKVNDGIVNQLLTELDGLESLHDIVFIAATNRPDLLDSALLRPGRIDKIIMVPAPDEKAREAILKVHTKGVKLDKSVSLKELAKKMKGFSGADIEGLVREAALTVLSENKMKPAPITMRHFDEVLAKSKPSIDDESERAYGEFKDKALDFRPTYVG